MIEKLKVYNVGEKIRVGKNNDGGYVLPKISIDKSVCLFSYGISHDISFDEQYIELCDFKNKAYGYDHTIDSVPTKYSDNFYLYKEGISGNKTETTDNFIQHYNSKEIKDRVLLKIDVEGAEYEFFNMTDIKDLSDKVTGMVVEFHDLHKENYRSNFWDIIDKINQHFKICHIHGNNIGEYFEYHENDFTCIMPKVIEITFIPNELAEVCSIDESTYPTPLDQPNYDGWPELDLSFLKLIK